jgi:hypothetical protein
MAKYKLLKDLPTFKAGDMFYMSEYGDLIYDGDNVGIKTCTWQILERFPNILTDWFEEIQEPTDSIHWKPKKGDNYFYIVHSYNLLHNEVLVSTWIDDDYDRTHYLLGNIYRSYEEAEKARNRKLAEVRLRRTSTFKPDFENDNGGWVIFYNPREKKLEVDEVYRFDYGEIVRYETKEDAQKSIKENERDWRIYFGVEENK